VAHLDGDGAGYDIRTDGGQIARQRRSIRQPASRYGLRNAPSRRQEDYAPQGRCALVSARWSAASRSRSEASDLPWSPVRGWFALADNRLRRLRHAKSQSQPEERRGTIELLRPTTGHLALKTTPSHSGDGYRHRRRMVPVTRAEAIGSNRNTVLPCPPSVLGEAQAGSSVPRRACRRHRDFGERSSPQKAVQPWLELSIWR
jgi:hypothetical protein